MEATQARIPAFRPFLTEAEADALSQAALSGWLGTGIYTRLFESRLASAVRSPYLHATNSGTAALHLALKVAGVEGGEVVTTPVSSVATSHAILHSGAEPVFADVDESTGNIDAAGLPALVSRRTRAIVVVHLGSACAMDPVLAVARERGLKVVEDCCAVLAAGGSYKGRPLGTLGELAAFSFGRFKGLTTVDGGAVAHAREAWAGRLARLRRLGHAEAGGALDTSPEGVAELGWHYRMHDLAAVVGLAQLARADELARRLDDVERVYRDGLASVAGVRLPEAPAWSSGVRGLFLLRVEGGRRDALRGWLAKGGIEAGDVLVPHTRYRLYEPYRRRRLPAAERFCSSALPLPCYPGLSVEEAGRVVERVRRFRG